MPNAKRGAPRTGSIPIMAISSPATVIRMPARSDRPARPVTRHSPTSIRAKNSGGPNSSAIAASGVATTTSAMTANMPPMKEPMAAMPRAVPPLPRFAISCPSMQVMTEAASPGTFRSTEVIVPPYMAP